LKNDGSQWYAFTYGGVVAVEEAVRERTARLGGLEIRSTINEETRHELKCLASQWTVMAVVCATSGVGVENVGRDASSNVGRVRRASLGFVISAESASITENRKGVSDSAAVTGFCRLCRLT
jgi:hypothetical protein